jgi:hypothetical protein
MTQAEARTVSKMAEDWFVGLLAENMANAELRSPFFNFEVWKKANDEARTRALNFGLSTLDLAARLARDMVGGSKSWPRSCA